MGQAPNFFWEITYLNQMVIKIKDQYAIVSSLANRCRAARQSLWQGFGIKKFGADLEDAHGVGWRAEKVTLLLVDFCAMQGNNMLSRICINSSAYVPCGFSKKRRLRALAPKGLFFVSDETTEPVTKYSNLNYKKHNTCVRT
jgi:hypothetical protein